MNIDEKTETFVYDVGNFLAAAGGNMGLFMGFSCLSIMFALIDSFSQWFLTFLCWNKELSRCPETTLICGEKCILESI